MNLVRTLKFCIRKIHVKNNPPSTPKSVSFRFYHQTLLCLPFLSLTCYNGTCYSMSAVEFLPEPWILPSQQWISVTSPLQYTVKQHYFTPCLQQHWRTSRLGSVRKALWDTAAVQISPVRRTHCDSGTRVLAETTTVSGVVSQDGSPSCAINAWTTYMVPLWDTTWLLVFRFVPQCCYIEMKESGIEAITFSISSYWLSSHVINILLRILTLATPKRPDILVPVLRQINSLYSTTLYDLKIDVNIVYRYKTRHSMLPPPFGLFIRNKWSCDFRNRVFCS